jgi:hypothetical protein
MSKRTWIPFPVDHRGDRAGALRENSSRVREISGGKCRFSRFHFRIWVYFEGGGFGT